VVLLNGERSLFTGPFTRTAGRINYGISPDGESFAMLDSGELIVPTK
jgi:hypothetical protein